MARLTCHNAICDDIAFPYPHSAGQVDGCTHAYPWRAEAAILTLHTAASNFHHRPISDILISVHY